MADASKPLPDIPVTHLLSVDARKHRRKVIKALLGLLNEVEPELEDPDWEDLGERDPGPVARIERALDTSSDIESLLPPSVHASSLIYLQCSLVVEETFLRECGVSMSYPHPKDKTKHSSAGSMSSPPLTESSPSSSKRTSFIPSSILNFFSKRSARNGDNTSPRSSFDSPPGYIRQRRFSLLHHNLHYPVKEVKREPEIYPLSTSPGVEFSSSSPSDFLRNQAICVLVNSHKMETFHYYTKDDQRLEAVLRSLDTDTDWTHAGVRIRATVSVDSDQPASSDTDHSPPEPAVDQPVIHLFSDTPLTPHLSFGKFIELVVYSPRMKAFLESHSNTLRFGIGTKLVAVTVERDISVYTLCAPRVQPSSSSSFDDVNADEDKVSLRREIRAWWETVAAHLDSIEEDIQVVTHKKRLPRLPSEWSDHPEDTPPPSSSTLSASSSSSGSDNPDVGSLRETCHAREQALYAQLAKCGIDGINGVRRQFLRAARDVDNVLTKMQHSSDGSTVKSKGSTGTVTFKMASGGDTVKEKPLDAGERHLSDNGEDQKTQAPVWWSQPCHVPPTGNVIVRENDWGSIIAFTMSTADYHASLAVASTQSEPLLTPSLSKAETPSFFSSFRASALSSASSSASSLHKESDIFDDGFSAVISRKETPTGMLEVFKDRGSKFNSLRFPQATQKSSDRRDSALSEAGSNGVPRSSWSKVTSASGTITGDARSMKVEMGSIDMTDNGSVSDTSEGGSDDTVAPQVPPKDIRFPGADPPTDENEQPPPLPSKSTLRSTLDRWLFANVAEGVTDARPHIKYDFTVSQGAFPSSPPAFAPSHPPAPRRLKFSCTIYYASSFSTLRSKCSVSNSAYVKSLSRIVPFNAEGGKSSSGFWRSEDGRWVIKGLVSKWGVADLGVLLGMGGRYFDWVLREAGGVGGMVKLMGFYTVEVRNLDTGVGEKVDLVVMENLFWGRNIDRKYDLKGIQTRKVKRKDKEKDKDKDKEGEKEKEKELPSSGVLFDAEWLQGPQLLVTPQSKAVLTSALCADAAWLAQSNIMDYSLLLGVDNEKGEIVGGIVDTIGSYTFAKTLEYNLKSNAARKPEEVTVVPPTEYQERFVAAINRYFVECPDMSSVESEGQREWDLPDMTSMHL